MSTPKIENMRIWDALGKTDPSHTKQFTRAGGFKGTAIKPMWANKQMTEFFGPCGIGWGMTEPSYRTVEAGGEILVFCTAGLWYIQNGMKHGPVYGQGGDKVLSLMYAKDNQGKRIPDENTLGGFKMYIQTDDEAFKKAYTDALSNAMKFIGVAADVHMGLFDDSKYVREVRAEFEAEQKAEVIAEVERQKQNPAKDAGANVAPITLNDRLQASVSAETRAAQERAKLSEEQGIFSLDNDVLTCKIVGIQKRETTGAKKTPYVVATFNGRLPNGANFASCFDKEMWEPLNFALDKECKLKMKLDGKLPNILDVLWIRGVGAEDLGPSFQATEDDLPEILR